MSSRHENTSPSSGTESDDDENREIQLNNRRSIVWKYFSEELRDNIRCAKCYECQAILKITVGTTSPLFNHLRVKHAQLWAICEAEREKKKSSNNDATTLRRQRRREISQEEKAKLDQSVAEMIALDSEPYAIVDRRGFRRLIGELAPFYELPSRTTLSRTIMPGLYEKMKLSVASEVSSDLKSGVNCVSFTTDIWTNDTGHSFLSLTIHYITPAFEAKNFTLGLGELEAHHTGVFISETLKEILGRYSILDMLEDIPVYGCTDNGRNIVSAISSIGWHNIYCFAHTLNLALQDSKKKYPELEALLSKARRIVTHFHHSTPSRKALEQEQRRENTQYPLKLIQMVPTRFNSEVAMLSRMLKLKKPLIQVLANIRLEDSLSGTDWQILKEIVEVLEPLNRATEISSGMKYPTLSMVIPLIHGINNRLTKLTDRQKHSLPRRFARSLIEAITNRFPETAEILLQKATFLDPRFKDILFTATQRDALRAALLDEIENETPVRQSSQSWEGNSQQPISQQLSNCSQMSSSSNGLDFWSFLPKSSTDAPSNDRRSVTNQEIGNYLQCSILDRNACPFDWWRNDGEKFSNLSFLARRYLSIPGGSIESERLFSTAGSIADNEKRARLLPENIEILTLLNKNL